MDYWFDLRLAKSDTAPREPRDMRKLSVDSLFYLRDDYNSVGVNLDRLARSGNIAILGRPNDICRLAFHRVGLLECCRPTRALRHSIIENAGPEVAIGLRCLVTV